MKLYFKLSASAIAENLTKGIELKQNQIIDLNFEEIAQEDRELLMRHLIVKNDALFAGLNNESPSGYFGRSGDEHYGCIEIDGIRPENIIAFYRNIEANAKARKAEEASNVNRATAIMTKFSSPDFRIYLQDKDGRFENIHFEYKGKSFSPGTWSTLSGIESAIADGSFEKWMSDIDEKISLNAKIKAEELEKAEADKIAKVAFREQLNTWAKENGSALLKLRLAHGQNWQDIALEEWAKSKTVGFGAWELDDTNEDWRVKNATLDQLLELEKAEMENPDHEIIIERCKFVQVDPEGEYEPEISHRTFLRLDIKTPIGIQNLYKEITDISEDKE